MKFFSFPLVVASLWATLATAFADEMKIGDFVFVNPWIREVPSSAKTTAGYVEIRNEGDMTDALTGARADFPRVQVHESRMENGVMTMKHVDAIELAPDTTIVLKQGGFHIMFMGLGGNVPRKGDIVEVTLQFKNSGEMTVPFTVGQPRDE